MLKQVAGPRYLFVFAKRYYLVEASQEAQQYRMQETQEMQVRSLRQEDPLEEEMATHSSFLTWFTELSLNIRAQVDMFFFFSWSFLYLVLEFLTIT